jgi:hypothetical protein
MKRIANRHETGNSDLAGFLNNHKLLNGIIIDKPQMSMSIKVLHDLIRKREVLKFQTG